MAGKSNSRRRRNALAAEREDYFVVVVPFLPLAEADVAFLSWLESAGLTRSDLAPRDVMIDTGEGDAGPVRRYRVCREAMTR
jgi:hypothetical protein